jgi:hypothetical protein
MPNFRTAQARDDECDESGNWIECKLTVCGREMRIPATQDRNPEPRLVKFWEAVFWFQALASARREMIETPM